MKLILVRTGKGEGGVVGTAIVDLGRETKAYYDTIKELTENELLDLLYTTHKRVEDLDGATVDFPYLRRHLEIGLPKNV